MHCCFTRITGSETMLRLVKQSIDVKIDHNLTLHDLLKHFRYWWMCMSDGNVPLEWKFAKVNPLYRGKGDLMDLNSFRAISVLPPSDIQLFISFVNGFERCFAEHFKTLTGTSLMPGDDELSKLAKCFSTTI
jgi:hypothetical protein